MPPRAPHRASAWHAAGGALFERYDYAAGPAPGVEVHVHDDYQFGLPEDLPGLYTYRGARVPVPAAHLSVIHPGEPHGSLPRDAHPRPTVYRMMYVPRPRFAALLRERGMSDPEPFFSRPVCGDPAVVGAFADLHRAGERAATPLELDVRLRRFVGLLLARHGHIDPPRPPSIGRGRLATARDLLLGELARNVSLDELGDAAGLSPYHLARAFAREFGLPPHRFQVFARVDRARRLLAAGHSPADTSRAVGFCDESHLHVHFKRLTGVTPGRYRAPRR